MSLTFDVVIAGAGIVGTACAAALSREGLRVAIVEPDVPGGGATAAGMGHIVVMDDSPAQFWLTLRSRTLWLELLQSAPPSVEFDRCGTLWVAADAEEIAAVEQKAAAYRAAGVRVEVLDAAQVAELEPNLRPGFAGGLLVPDDCVIYAPAAAAWLLKESSRRNAVFFPGRRVVSFSRQGVVLSSGERLAAAFSVCAAGAWAAELLVGLPVRPRKGHLAITDRYPGFVRHQIVELGYLKSAHGTDAESVAFNVQPRKTGQVLIGSSRQFGDTSTAIRSAMLAKMLRRATEYMPSLRELNVIRCWTGFRAATPDKSPLIGPHPGSDWVILATGHEGLGITTAPATAELVADLICGRTPALDPAPFSPGRFPVLASE